MKKLLAILFVFSLQFTLCNLKLFAQSLDSAEYFIDSDPGIGNGTQIAINHGDTTIDSVYIHTNGLTTGFHNLFFRVRDTNRVWSLYEGGRFFIYDSTAAAIPASFTANSGEHFFDTDPGIRNGTALTAFSSDSIMDTLYMSTAGLTSGFHNLFFRAKDSSNFWSLYEGQRFYIYDSISQTIPANPIVAGEYFYDSDPGIGNATALANFSHSDTVLLNDSLPTAPLTAGKHNLFVRMRDSMNVWSLYEGNSFLICNMIPVADFTSDSVCFHTPTHFTDLTTNQDSTGNYTYSWDFNSDGITDDTTRGNTAHTFTTAGTQTVTLVVNNVSGCEDTIVKTVYVDSLPIVTLNLPLDTLCKLDTLVLSGGNPTGGTYSGPGIYNGIFYTDSTTIGNKTITYTYVNSNSCSATATDIIHINACAGVNELSSENVLITVSPNPFSANAVLQISNISIANCQLKIYNVIGKEISVEVIRNSDSFIISRGNLNAGIYFYKIISEHGIIGTGKLVITD